ncbi:hypothetical protein M885DRAFT_115881 [Pelagophyceae sp. CCMP2097]|nr:hypothetical protein M885DRAFT_115881 [Pelagophyceae sp. CCMP2097]
MFALLLAGGLRTFSVTWPLTRESVVDANGGRANFWIGISAPFSGAQHELAAAARDVCKRERFDSCDIRLENASATREFYAGTHRGENAFWSPAADRRSAAWVQRSFAFQWESVTRGFQALERSGANLDLVVRGRPDVVFLRPLRLERLRAAIRNQSKEAVVPCAVGPGRLVDDVVIAEPAAMRSYAARLAGPRSVETHVANVLKGRYVFQKVNHAILDFPFVDDYVERAVYKTAHHRLHDRCLAKNTPPSRRGRDLSAFNETDLAAVRRYVSRQLEATNSMAVADVGTKRTTNRLNAV